MELAFFLITVGTGTVFVAGFIGGGLGISFTTAFRNKIDQRHTLHKQTLKCDRLTFFPCLAFDAAVP